ncbi:MAG: aromatic ring-hydroxylating dioxygenase subunit alpha [Actinomycetota bacterium]
MCCSAPGVLAAIEPTRALPASAYRDPEVFEAERRGIWHGGWVWVGTADQIAAAGDHIPVWIAGQPVIVLRAQDGTVRALSNLCAHRGTLLVDEPGNAKRFQCPYHAWTFTDDGALLSVPFAQRDDVDKDAHCLPAYRAEVWHGLVFVSLEPDVEPVADRLAHLEPFAIDASLAALHHWTSERSEDEWAANWKLAVTNAMESYHLFKVHPETLEPTSPTSTAYYLTGNADGTATGGAVAKHADYVLLSLPPNFVGVITAGMFLWQAVMPIAPDRSRVITGGAFTSPSPGDQSGMKKWATKAMSAAANAVVPDFLPEDKWICERGQTAASGDFTPGVLVPMEQVVVDFHHFLDRALHASAVPPVRTSAEVGIAKDAG